MRVIAGTARGRRLSSFSGTTIRPTPDRVREALFSMLSSRMGSLHGLKVLDLFSGSGAMGIEALSRGAAHACFVDQSDQAITTIRENLHLCNLVDQATIIVKSVDMVDHLLRQHGPFDLIFMDPPYNRDLVPATLRQLARLDLLCSGGIICAETAAAEDVPAMTGQLQLAVTKRYGSTSIHLYQRVEQEQS